jgi:hypothetical protein
MGLGRFFRSLAPGNDHELAARDYPDQESASDRAARLRRENHHRNIARNGDNAGTKFSRRARRNAF